MHTIEKILSNITAALLFTVVFTVLASPHLRADSPTTQVVFKIVYTPEAGQDEGGHDAIVNRVTQAFSNANVIFQNSKTDISLKIGYIEPLRFNEDDNDQFPPDSCTECASLNRIHKPDADMIIVRQGIAWARIPISTNQALQGGRLWFGLGNVGGSVLAHEAGHMLGLNHGSREVVEGRMWELSPAGGVGNVFRGSSGNLFHTVMSYGDEALSSTLIPYFSSPDLVYDGVPTGETEAADAVNAMKFWVKYVSKAGERAYPDPVKLWVTWTGFKTILSGSCIDVEGNALENEPLEFFTLDGAGDRSSIGTTLCNSQGSFSFKKNEQLSGSFQAVHAASGQNSKWATPLNSQLSLKAVAKNKTTVFSGICYQSDGLTPSAGEAIEILLDSENGNKSITETSCSAEGSYESEFSESLSGQVFALSPSASTDYVQIITADEDDDNDPANPPDQCTKKKLKKLKKKYRKYRVKENKKKIKKIRKKIKNCKKNLS